MNGGFAGVAGGWQGGGGGQTTPSGKGDQNPLSDRREEGEDPEPHTDTLKKISGIILCMLRVFFQMKNCAKRYFWAFFKAQNDFRRKARKWSDPPPGGPDSPAQYPVGGGAHSGG